MLAAPGGSSSRGWGTLNAGIELTFRNRFIPTGAGSAVTRCVSGAWCAVHPRRCGERGVYTSSQGGHHGSSPRVRGTPVGLLLGGGQVRFIPAGAGNASRGWRRCDRNPVHPRGCGERFHTNLFESHFLGSSPRVRGTLAAFVSRPLYLRFIPAGAGNARGSNRSAVVGAVHPRGCGERVAGEPVALVTAGSSPRVRGTQQRFELVPVVGRFIPAGAGNAVGCLRAMHHPPVHPRGCGERLSAFSSSMV